jgi:hypothetical protein
MIVGTPRRIVGLRPKGFSATEPSITGVFSSMLKPAEKHCIEVYFVSLVITGSNVGGKPNSSIRQ